MGQDGMIELKDFLRIVKNKFLLISGITITFTAVSCIFIFLIIPPTYEAETTIIIGKPASGSTQAATYDFSEIEMYQKLVSTYNEIAKSRKVAENAAKEIGNGMNTETVQKALFVTSKEDTQIISLKAQSKSSKEAADIVNAVAASLIDESKNIFNLGNIQILDNAQVPQSPVKPRKGLDLAICFVIGLIISIIIVFISDYMNKTFRSEKDIEEYLKLDVLAAIPDN